MGYSAARRRANLSLRQHSQQVYRIFVWLGTANCFDFALARLAEGVETDVVGFVVEQFVEFVAKQHQLFFREVAFKQAELGPAAKTAEEFVEFGAAFVAGGVVGDDVEHWQL